jgi:hypothetical protein
MPLFPLFGVLRGFSAATDVKFAFLPRYARGANPCAALLDEKIAHL